MKSTSEGIRVVILNGFLGSGKTTLFRSLISQGNKKGLTISAVINDMSDLDVDGELIGNSDLAEQENFTFESIHSCVLSSKKGIASLDESIQRLLSYSDPDLFIIETSGSCHPMPLIDYFNGHSLLQLTGVLVLVDGLMLTHDYDLGQKLVPMMQENMRSGKRDMVNLLIEQIMFSSHLILTKGDRIDQTQLPEIARAIQPINPFVSIFSVQFGKLLIDDLYKMPPYNFHRVAQLIHELKPVLEAESEGDRPYNMATRVIRDDRPFHPQRLWEICHGYLDQRIYRSKGFFWLASRDEISLLWNQAAGSINLELIGYWRSGILANDNHGLSEFEVKALQDMLASEKGAFGDRHCHLTVIGDKNHVDAFTEALKECFLTQNEIEHWRSGGSFPDPWPMNIVELT